MRPVMGHEQVQKQRSALQSVGLLVKVEEAAAAQTAEVVATEVCLQRMTDPAEGLDPNSEQEWEHEQETEPLWVRNRRMKQDDENAKEDMTRDNHSESEMQRKAGNSDNNRDGNDQEKLCLEGTACVSIASVSDTLVLRCSTSCSPADLWRYVRDTIISLTCPILRSKLSTISVTAVRCLLVCIDVVGLAPLATGPMVCADCA